MNNSRQKLVLYLCLYLVFSCLFQGTHSAISTSNNNNKSSSSSNNNKSISTTQPKSNKPIAGGAPPANKSVAKSKASDDDDGMSIPDDEVVAAATSPEEDKVDVEDRKGKICHTRNVCTITGITQTGKLLRGYSSTVNFPSFKWNFSCEDEDVCRTPFPAGKLAPGYTFIGRGFDDVTGQYKTPQVIEYTFDENSKVDMMGKTYIYPDQADIRIVSVSEESGSSEFYESFSSCMQKQATEFSLGASYSGFGVSAAASMSVSSSSMQSAASTSKGSVVKKDELFNLYEFSMKRDEAKISKSFMTDVCKVHPHHMFGITGTSFLQIATLGGRRMFYQSTNEKLTSSKERSSFKSSLDVMVSGYGVGVNSHLGIAKETENAASNFKKTTEFKTQCFGGNVLLCSDQGKGWRTSVLLNPTPTKISTLSIIELFPESVHSSLRILLKAYRADAKVLAQNIQNIYQSNSPGADQKVTEEYAKFSEIWRVPVPEIPKPEIQTTTKPKKDTVYIVKETPHEAFVKSHFAKTWNDATMIAKAFAWPTVVIVKVDTEGVQSMNELKGKKDFNQKLSDYIQKTYHTGLWNSKGPFVVKLAGGGKSKMNDFKSDFYAALNFYSDHANGECTSNTRKCQAVRLYCGKYSLLETGPETQLAILGSELV